MDYQMSALTDKVTNLEKMLAATQLQIAELKNAVNQRTKVSDLVNSEDNLMTHINALKGITNGLEQRLAMIKLPDETRFYLEESEIVNVRSNFSKLAAMMSDFEALYSNLVAYNSSTSS